MVDGVLLVTIYIKRKALSIYQYSIEHVQHGSIKGWNIYLLLHCSIQFVYKMYKINGLYYINSQ